MIFKTRTCQADPWGLTIKHNQGDEPRSIKGSDITYIPSQQGDVSLHACPSGKHFELSLSEDRGRDRDNYDSSWDIEIELDATEAHELLLALTVWLERQHEDHSTL